MKIVTKRYLIIAGISILLFLSSILSLNALALEPWQARLRSHPLHKKTVKIGIIAPSTGTFEAIQPIVQFAMGDINAFCDKLGYDVNFEFIMENADSNKIVHQQKVEYFHSMNINLLIAGFWSSQATHSLDYVNEHGILMFSPSSTDPSLAFAGDNLYRLCPPDDKQCKAIAAVLESKGIDAIVAIQRDDPMGYWIYEALDAEYDGDSAQVTYSTDLSNLDEALTLADVTAAGFVEAHQLEHTGVLLISYEESDAIIQKVPDYDTLDQLVWFGWEGTRENANPELAVIYQLYSTKISPPKTELWDDFTERLGFEPGFYHAGVYDICWIYAGAVLKASTAETAAVKAILMDEANSHFGVTGWCRLNEFGDRDYRDFDVWKCADVDGSYEWVCVGLYQGRLEILNWFE